VRFVAVRAGATDRAGNIQILDGLQAGERVVMHSKSLLHSRSRITLVKPNKSLL